MYSCFGRIGVLSILYWGIYIKGAHLIATEYSDNQLFKSRSRDRSRAVESAKLVRRELRER